MIYKTVKCDVWEKERESNSLVAGTGTNILTKCYVARVCGSVKHKTCVKDQQHDAGDFSMLYKYMCKRAMKKKTYRMVQNVLIG